MLATLPTIATPRCSEGVGISGDVGRLLGHLVIVIFYVSDSYLVYVSTTNSFCDYRCSDSVPLTGAPDITL